MSRSTLTLSSQVKRLTAEVALLKQERDEAREMALTLMEAADACERVVGDALWQTLDAREAMEAWTDT
jgi:outer membrane murein-binding lipoprotein Lpp